MDEALENKMILNAYRGVLRSIKSRRSKEETKIIRKAFNLLLMLTEMIEKIWRTLYFHLWPQEFAETKLGLERFLLFVFNARYVETQTLH